jgi:hypothetical protein
VFTPLLIFLSSAVTSVSIMSYISLMQGLHMTFLQLESPPQGNIQRENSDKVRLNCDNQNKDSTEET